MAQLPAKTRADIVNVLVEASLAADDIVALSNQNSLAASDRARLLRENVALKQSRLEAILGPGGVSDFNQYGASRPFQEQAVGIMEECAAQGVPVSSNQITKIAYALSIADATPLRHPTPDAEGILMRRAIAEASKSLSGEQLRIFEAALQSRRRQEKKG